MGIILAVGSQPDMVDMIEEAVRGFDHEIHCVTDPGKAVKVVESVELDAVIVDIHEQGKHLVGVQLAEILHQYRDIHTVVIATSDEPGDKHTALAAGFDAFLVKPFDFSYLRATLQMYLTEGGMTIRT
ncbi:MAG: response regulator [Chloroflexota bacterium]